MPAAAVKNKLRTNQKNVFSNLKATKILYRFETTELWRFSSLQAKLQQFRNYGVLLRIAQAFEKAFGCRSNGKNCLFCFRNFRMLAKAEKNRLLKLTDQSELNSFTNVLDENIDIAAPKI